MKGNSYPSTTQESIVKENQDFLQGFHCLLNYWEIKPSQYDNKLQELIMQNIREISTFVPWAHFESDIHHGLHKFLRSAAQYKIKINLIVMPDAGIHYPNAGIPREILNSNANLASDRSGMPIVHRGSPNLFQYPSFSSSDVLKSIGNFLLKLSGLIQEVTKEYKNIEILIHGGFYRYYRNPSLATTDHGDYSASHVFAYKEFLDREYPSKLSEPDSDLQKFKSSIYEPINRHIYLNHAEKTLIEKTHMIFARKLNSTRIRTLSLVNPELLPENSTASLMCQVLQFKTDVSTFVQEILNCSKKGEVIHFSSSGGFQSLSPNEKHFLIELATVACGECFVPVESFIELSEVKQNEIRSTKEKLKHYLKDTQITYFSSSVWNADSRIFDRLEKAVGGMISQTSELSYQRSRTEKLFFTDPKMIVRLIELVQALSIAQSGKIVALPAPFFMEEQEGSMNFAAEALQHLERFKATTGNGIKIKTGLYYEIYECGLGSIVLYDAACFWKKNNETLSDQDCMTFVQAMLGLSEIKLLCNASNEDIKIINYIDEQDSGSCMVYMINPTDQAIETTVQFSKSVIFDSGKGKEVNDKFIITLPPYEMKSFLAQEASVSDLNYTQELKMSEKGVFDGIEA